MKKSVLLGIIGLAAGAATSYGQGYFALDNYDSSSFPLITYGAGVPANGVSGAIGSGGLNSDWTVGLYFVGGTVSLVDPAGNGIPNAALALGTGSGSTATPDADNVFNNPGQFASPSEFYAGSATDTTVTLEVVAYDGSSYANAAFRGHSAPFSMPTVTITAVTPTYVGDYMTSFAVTAVPEPTTLALAGLGGLASLVALRRKQA